MGESTEATTAGTFRDVSRAGSRHKQVRTLLPHDVGGQRGHGSIPVSADEVFVERWHARSFGITQVAHGLSKFNTDAFRHGLEREDAQIYRSKSYWHRWILNAERMLVEGGILGRGAVDSHVHGTAVTESPVRTSDCLPHGERGNTRTIKTPPKFEVGQSVCVLADYTSTGHTRLPEYVAGRSGVVAALNGVWVFPDTHAHGEGENPCWVYSVAFRASTLWPIVRLKSGGLAGSNNETATDGSFGDAGQPTTSEQVANDDEAGHTVMVDVFEPYLETSNDERT